MLVVSMVANKLRADDWTDNSVDKSNCCTLLSKDESSANAFDLSKKIKANIINKL